MRSPWCLLLPSFHWFLFRGCWGFHDGPALQEPVWLVCCGWGLGWIVMFDVPRLKFIEPLQGAFCHFGWLLPFCHLGGHFHCCPSVFCAGSTSPCGRCGCGGGSGASPRAAGSAGRAAGRARCRRCGWCSGPSAGGGCGGGGAPCFVCFSSHCVHLLLFCSNWWTVPLNCPVGLPTVVYRIVLPSALLLSAKTKAGQRPGLVPDDLLDIQHQASVSGDSAVRFDCFSSRGPELQADAPVHWGGH
jgi:hypothetical protein